MKILITGADGFIGKNLKFELENRGYNNLLLCDVETTIQELEDQARECEFVFHLAGVNRPEKQEDYMPGNFGFTTQLVEALKRNNNKSPIIMTSSIQALLNNPYGESKLAGEEYLLKYSSEESMPVYVYRLNNVFGKWCRPNYNSVVATFCHNVANDLPVKINDGNTNLNLIYIDDVVNTLISAMEGKEKPAKDGKYYVHHVYQINLGELADNLYAFKQARQTLQIPALGDLFKKKLYSTYLSYLPKENFSYDLKMNTDERGSFTEFLKTEEDGQVSVNISKPGITKGNHWHKTKTEKFLVVSGKGVIRFRKIDEDEIIEYIVSGEKLQVVDIPPGYTHNISNVGNTDMVTIMWANEKFDTENPDTYFLEV